MSVIHTLTGATPPARFDEVAWTSVRIEEASASTGPWTTADTLVLDPVDADPAAPQSRNLTFEATLEAGYFRLVWLDAAANSSPPSEPVFLDGGEASAGWAPEYATADELKGLLDIPDAGDDAELAFALAAASRAIDAHTGRQFGKVTAPEARYYTARRGRVEIDDLMSTAGLVVKTDPAGDGGFLSTLVIETDFRLSPWNAAADGRPWTTLVADGAALPAHERGVEITAEWGWDAVPAVVTQACLLQASRLFKRRQAPFGVAGSIELGSEMRLLSKLDPDVELLLNAVRRRWLVA